MKKSLKQRFHELITLPFGFERGHHAPDYFLIIVFAIILAFGLLMLSSASSVAAFQDHNNSYYYVQGQFFKGILPGLVLFYIFSVLDYRILKRWAFPLLLATIGLLLAVFLPGIGSVQNHVHGWINLGLFDFQPTEVIKITFLIYLATWLERRWGQGLKDPQYGFIPFIVILAIVSILILAEPDTGTLLIIVASSLIVYFIAEAPMRFLYWIIGAGFVLFLIAILIAPYRLQRIVTFLNPSADPQGTGYQITQAKLAIGSGGFWGLGIGQSRQKFNYLPQVYNDSIFAIIAEEMGFILTLPLIMLYILMTLRGFRIGSRAPDKFGQFLAIGLTSSIILQTLINIGAMVGILPLTGVPLPFISHGGTSFAISMAAVGILVNISKQTKT